MLGRYDCNVLDVEGDRRILLVRAVRVRDNESSGDSGSSDSETKDNSNGRGGGETSDDSNERSEQGLPTYSTETDNAGGELGAGGEKVFRDGEWVEPDVTLTQGNKPFDDGV